MESGVNPIQTGKVGQLGARIMNYFSLIKFAHTLFAMPFALIGFFYGLKVVHYQLDRPWWQLFVLVILCMVFARSAAMAFNRWLDAGFDAKNPRTAVREIPSGLIGKKSVLRFVLFNCVAFLITTYYINLLCFALAPVALLVILFYSYTKRFTPLCHLVLGLGLSLAPLGAYIAVTGEFGWVPILFSLSVICWVSGFDIIYALQDEEFDQKHQLYSIPSFLGSKKALQVSRSLHFLAVVAVVAAGIAGHFAGWYWTGVGVFAFFLFYQHTLVGPSDLSKVNKAFFSSNGIASVVFCVLVLADLFLTS